MNGLVASQTQRISILRESADLPLDQIGEKAHYLAVLLSGDKAASEGYVVHSGFLRSPIENTYNAGIAKASGSGRGYRELNRMRYYDRRMATNARWDEHGEIGMLAEWFAIEAEKFDIDSGSRTKTIEAVAHLIRDSSDDLHYLRSSSFVCGWGMGAPPGSLLSRPVSKGEMPKSFVSYCCQLLTSCFSVPSLKAALCSKDLEGYYRNLRVSILITSIKCNCPLASGYVELTDSYQEVALAQGFGAGFMPLAYYPNAPQKTIERIGTEEYKRFVRSFLESSHPELFRPYRERFGKRGELVERVFSLAYFRFLAKKGREHLRRFLGKSFEPLLGTGGARSSQTGARTTERAYIPSSRAIIKQQEGELRVVPEVIPQAERFSSSYYRQLARQAVRFVGLCTRDVLPDGCIAEVVFWSDTDMELVQVLPPDSS